MRPHRHLNTHITCVDVQLMNFYTSLKSQLVSVSGLINIEQNHTYNRVFLLDSPSPRVCNSIGGMRNLWIFKILLNTYRGSGTPVQYTDAVPHPYLQAGSQYCRQWTHGGGTSWRGGWQSPSTPATTSYLICSGLKLWVEWDHLILHQLI